MVYYCAMTFTIQQLAKAAGVTIRTLHYYDEIGLLSPSFVRPNGYRIYEDNELLKLQQILFFRELEFPLDEIARLMRADDFNEKAVLTDQRTLLEMKKERINKLLTTINERLKGGKHMSDAQLFGSFSRKQMDAYKEEAKKRWGHTDAYKQSAERAKHWTKEDYARIEKEGKEITEKLAKLTDRGIEDPDVQRLIARHYAYIDQFYDVPVSMYRNLGDMYVADTRFTAYYDKFRPGLAAFVRDAIRYFCDRNRK